MHTISFFYQSLPVSTKNLWVGSSHWFILWCEVGHAHGFQQAQYVGWGRAASAKAICLPFCSCYRLKLAIAVIVRYWSKFTYLSGWLYKYYLKWQLIQKLLDIVQHFSDTFMYSCTYTSEFYIHTPFHNISPLLCQLETTPFSNITQYLVSHIGFDPVPEEQTKY